MKSAVTVAVCSVFVGAVLALPAQGAINTNSLVGAWLMEDTDEGIIPDASGNGHDGTIEGNVEFAAGKFGSALDLAGGGEVLIIPEFGMASPTTEVTITVWAVLEGDKNQDIVSFDPLVGNNRTTIHMGWDGAVIWQHGVDQNYAAKKLPIEAWDNWIHWAFVGSAKGNYLRILMNGEEFSKREDEPTAKPAFVASAQNWNIGGRKGNSFEGLIDEVAVFDAPLSDDDINTIMTDGLGLSVLGQAVEPAGKLATMWGSVKSR